MTTENAAAAIVANTRGLWEEEKATTKAPKARRKKNVQKG